MIGRINRVLRRYKLHGMSQIRDISETVGFLQKTETVRQTGLDLFEIFTVYALLFNQLQILHHGRDNRFALRHACIS